MEEIDIWRTAGTLIALRGEEQALFEAGQRADALNEQGDAAGMGVWIQVVHAIETLTKERIAEPLN